MSIEAMNSFSILRDSRTASFSDCLISGAYKLSIKEPELSVPVSLKLSSYFLMIMMLPNLSIMMVHSSYFAPLHISQKRYAINKYSRQTTMSRLL